MRDGLKGVSRASTLPPPRPSAAHRSDENRHARTEHAPVGTWKMRARHTASIGFPFSDFRHSLTLFSKFFASFPHGTCSLSVSHQYLALDGIYHLFGLQSQANRLVEDRPYGLTRGTDGIVTLSDALFQGTSPRVAPGLASVDYNPTAVAASLQSGLVPLHSPLLRESLLVSFPPLNNMFKFSGSSYLSPALKHEVVESHASHSTTRLGV